MKRFFVLIVGSVMLASCGGTTTSGVTCSQNYWDGTVGTCLPANWDVVTRENLDAKGLPPEVITAFQSQKAVSGQTPVVLVTKETLAQPVTPKDYSDASIRSVTGLPGYKLIDTQPVTVDGQSVQLHIYSAQPSASEPAHRFYQVSTSSGALGFTFTGLTPLSVDTNLEQQVELILKHASLKNPALAPKA